MIEVADEGNDFVDIALDEMPDTESPVRLGKGLKVSRADNARPDREKSGA